MKKEQKDKIIIYEYEIDYKQYAYLVRIKDNDFLVIGLSSYRDSGFGFTPEVGNVLVDLDDIYIKLTSRYKLKDSSLYNDYLFNYWLNSQVESKIETKEN